MFLTYKEGLRGGICDKVQSYAEANNKKDSGVKRKSCKKIITKMLIKIKIKTKII